MSNSDAFYLEVRVEVEGVLNELGADYVVKSEGVYDELTLTTGEGATRTVRGVVADQQVANSIGQTANVESSDFKWTALRTLVLSQSSLPQPNETVEIDGRSFSFSKVVKIQPANIPMLYLLDISL